MADANLFWLGMVVYAFILFLFLYMTWKEQAANDVPWARASIGFLGCVFWPVTVVIFAIAMLRRGSGESGSD